VSNESSDHFRRVLGRLPTGVVIVTGIDGEQPFGLVCGSFMSVSLVPPLVAVAPAKTSTSWPSIEATGSFCANVLTEEQEQLARRFAVSGGDKFAGADWRRAPGSGSPLLDNVAAWIDCRVYKRIEAGDHWLVLGEVLDLSVQRESGALVFHGGAYFGLGGTVAETG
jgi:flavin reductase (DIM6/NTAB) family NADH-FMN oxidoreductase RutF